MRCGLWKAGKRVTAPVSFYLKLYSIVLVRDFIVLYLRCTLTPGLNAKNHWGLSWGHWGLGAAGSDQRVPLSSVCAVHRARDARAQESARQSYSVLYESR